MRKYVLEFFRRGLIACGFGPLILAILYLVLQQQANLETLAVNQVCLGIFSISALAFLAGGMNVIYQIEQIPLMIGIFIHGIVLYFGYLVTYLLNNWLKQGFTPIFIFTVIFILGYLVVWMVIYIITRTNTEKLNRLLEEKQRI